MELGIINDLLMDAYFEVRYNQPLRARLTLGRAATIISKIKKDSPELELLFDIVHNIRDGLKSYKDQDGVLRILMEDISYEIRKVRTWHVYEAA